MSGNAVTAPLTSVSYLPSSYLKSHTTGESQIFLPARWRPSEEKKSAEIDLKHFKTLFSLAVQNHCQEGANAVSEKLEQKSCPCE